MRFFVILASLVVFTISRSSSQNNALQRAFLNITEALGQRNHLVLVIVADDVRNTAAILKTSAGTPHIVTKWNKLEMLQLNSSAIVLLDSIPCLEDFNNLTIPPLKFSL